MNMTCLKKFLLVAICAFTMTVAFTSSAVEIPKASGKALGVTKGKSFDQGLVFINGKYIEPPYVVERWGTGIRINGTPVISQVVDWTEFIKTQAGVKVTKTESAAPEAEPEEPEEEEDDLDDLDEDDSDSSLDDLFDDDPKPKKSAAKKPAKKKKAKKRPPKPTTIVSYQLEGDFVANDASKALLQRVNKVRTDINKALLSGGIQIFGENYARVSADAHAAEQVLTNLPDIQKRSTSAAELIQAVRSAGLVYLTRPICEDLFRNRVDYLKLQQRRTKWQKERDFKNMLNGGTKY